MTLSRTMTRFGLVAAAAALLLTIGLAAAGSASAQVLPAVLYGKGLTAGQTVGASIGGVSCGTATVTSAGEWTMNVETNAACNPTAGAAISFTINGQPAVSNPPAVWQSGGTPPNVATGYALTLAQATATATATRTATPAVTATATTPATTSTPGAVVTATPAAPTAPKTGNAGLLGEDSGNGALWLLVGLAAVAGAGVAARQLYGRRSG